MSDQQRHDKYVAKLEEVTSKPLPELTLEEFNWLVTRIFLPIGESERSRTRREYAQEIISACQTKIHRQWETEVEKTGKISHIHTINELIQQTHQYIQENKIGWGNQLALIFGQWPGNETDEQIQQALEELS